MNESVPIRDDTVLLAAQGLFDEGHMTLVVLDDDLQIEKAVGGKGFEITAGAHVTDAFPALIGYENELGRMQSSAETHWLRLPNLAVLSDEAGREEAGDYFSLTAYRDRTSGRLVVLAEDASEGASLQQQMIQQHNELSLAQRALAQARDKALSANRAKTAFIANVSHELRTPLNVIIGNAEILIKKRKTALTTQEVSDYAEDILSSGEFLLELINDLIDLSQAETGNLQLYEDAVDVQALVQDAVGMASRLPLASDKIIEMRCAADLPLFTGDMRRLKQALLNLLGNAIKFTEAGSRITVTAILNDQGDLALTVSDDGPGLTAEQLSIALAPFGQVNSERRHLGAGLGLSIVRSLAELHQGGFDVTTAPGAGFSATLTLPSERFVSATES